jgi:hypothetical protein
MQLNLKTIGPYTESTDLFFKTFQKNYSFCDDVLLKQPRHKHASRKISIYKKFLSFSEDESREEGKEGAAKVSVSHVRHPCHVRAHRPPETSGEETQY